MAQRFKKQDEDDFDENDVLRDGGRYRVPVHLQDSLSRAVAEHVNKSRRVTDANGDDGLALCRPGFRKISGGGVDDTLARLETSRDAADAYAIAEQRMVNAWKRKDAMAAEADDDDDDDDLLEAKRQGIRAELIKAGASEEEISDYLDDCGDDDLDNNPDEHRAAFIARSRGKDGCTAAVDRAYAQYEAEMRDAWRQEK
jgi:hypothetical protein